MPSARDAVDAAFSLSYAVLLGALLLASTSMADGGWDWGSFTAMPCRCRVCCRECPLHSCPAFNIVLSCQLAQRRALQAQLKLFNSWLSTNSNNTFTSPSTHKTLLLLPAIMDASDDYAVLHPQDALEPTLQSIIDHKRCATSNGRDAGDRRTADAF